MGIEDIDKYSSIAASIRRAAEKHRGNETGFRIDFQGLISEYGAGNAFNVEFDSERTLSDGTTPDATFNNVIFEFKAPGQLSASPNHRITKKAIFQIQGYMRRYGDDSWGDVRRVLGVVTDGFFIIFVRHNLSGWRQCYPQAVNTSSIEELFHLLNSYTGCKPFTPEELNGDFGGNSDCARKLIPALYSSLEDVLNTGERHIVGEIFDQWTMFFGETSGHGVFDQADDNSPEIKDLIKMVGIKGRNVSPPLLIFVVHTYFAMVAKYATYYALSPSLNPLGNPIKILSQSENGDIHGAVKKLEGGGVFEHFGIHNFLEGDFFRWYLDAWTENVAYGVRHMAILLNNFDTSTLDERTQRDLLKGLYQMLLPPRVRHALGEYYTPDWLASHLLGRVQYEGGLKERVLDPACGSGTFLVAAISKLRERCAAENYSDGDTLDLILNNVVGIDLNPLAVIAARANYLLAIRDLLVSRVGEITIPVYLADSVVIPRTSGELGGFEYKIPTVVGKMSVPAALKSAPEISMMCRLIEEYLEMDAEVSVFLGKIKTEIEWFDDFDQENALIVLEGLYNKLLDLHRRGLDGIWARIIRNAFMPMFIGKFDFVVGNPPWIAWETLPEEYRDRTRDMWFRYGLFPLSGFAARMGGGKKDFSMLMSYAVTHRFLKKGGRLGFLITQTVFKSAETGLGFRRYRIDDQGEKIPLRLEVVDDMTKIQPFEGASTQTSSFVWTRGKKTTYPIKYNIWRKREEGSLIVPSQSLEEVHEHVDIQSHQAVPVKPNKRESRLLNGQPKAIEVVKSWLESVYPLKAEEEAKQYKAHAGVYTGANGVYWMDELDDKLPEGRILVGNRVQDGRRRVSRQQVSIEGELLFPIIKGRDIRMWGAKSTHSVLIVQDPKTKRGISVELMQSKYPRAYKYLKSNEEVLRSRAVFKNITPKLKGENVMMWAHFTRCWMWESIRSNLTRLYGRVLGENSRWLRLFQLTG